MSETRVVVSILNQLLAAEARTLVPRLAEAGAFVSWASADEQALLQRVIADEREHQAALVDCILSADGVPAPVTADLDTASLHFLDLHALVPRILADKQRLVGLYRAAEAQLDPGTDAHQVTQRLAAAQRDHLAALQRLAKAREEAVSRE